MKKTLFTTVALTLLTTGISAQDFTATTAEGIEMTFNVVSTTDKTAAVGHRVSTNGTAIDKATTGEVTIPATVTYNGEEYTVVKVDEHAFKGCASITKVSLPKTCTIIDSYGFNGCTSLTSVSGLEACTTVQSYAFDGAQLKTADLASCTELGQCAFNNCTSLESVNIPLLTVIPSMAFSSCTALTTIDLKNVTQIEQSAFSYCSSLTNVDLQNVTSLGTAFRECSALTTVSNLSKVTIIESYTFYNCNNLKTVGDLSNVTEIDNHAFYSCDNLEDVDLSACTTIGEKAFYECKTLTTIDISCCTNIGKEAFNGCNALTTVICNNLTPPSSNIENGSYFLPQTTTITLYVPKSAIDTYKASVFCKPWNLLTGGVKAVEDLSMKFSIPTIEDVNVTYKISALNAKTCSVGDGGNNAVRTNVTGTVTIPETVTYLSHTYRVTKINDMALFGCKITKVNLPDGLTIGEAAFENCASMSSINLSKVTDIGPSAFFDCKALTFVDISACTSLQAQAFMNCTKLTTVIGPKNHTGDLGLKAFADCNALKLVYMPCTTPPAIETSQWSQFLNISDKCRLYIPAGTLAKYTAAGWTTTIFKGGIIGSGSMKGDVDGDGEVTAQDASLIQQKVAGKIEW